METDWAEGLYYGITLKYNYEQGYVEISIPSSRDKKCIEHEHIAPKWPHYCLYQPDPIKYGKNFDKITPGAASLLLNKSDKKFVQQILGSFLYYARAIDLTILHLLLVMASDRASPP